VACVDQDGTSPLANIVQIGSAGRVSVNQSGGTNQSAYVQQGDSAGSVTVTQQQADGLVSNSPPLMQGLTAFTSLLSGAPHFNDVGSYSSVVLQSSGNSNQAEVLQDAGNNASYGEIGQLGSNNQANITQGYLAQAALDSNYASIVQQGTGNAASVTQTGSGLNGSISQTGDSYSASLSQTGTSMAAVAIAQSGGATNVNVGSSSVFIPGAAVTVTQDSGAVLHTP
jgi:minor curlin subunit